RAEGERRQVRRAGARGLYLGRAGDRLGSRRQSDRPAATEKPSITRGRAGRRGVGKDPGARRPIAAHRKVCSRRGNVETKALYLARRPAAPGAERALLGRQFRRRPRHGWRDLAVRPFVLALVPRDASGDAVRLAGIEGGRAGAAAALENGARAGG